MKAIKVAACLEIHPLLKAEGSRPESRITVGCIYFL